MAVTALVVYNGVEDGSEKVSGFMMPVLLVLVVVIAGYSLTSQNTGADGVTRTSCISILESIAANCVEIFHTERKRPSSCSAVIYLAASAVIALGYGVFYFELPLPNGSVGQLLDRMDYISNSVMMFVLFLQPTGILS